MQFRNHTFSDTNIDYHQSLEDAGLISEQTREDNAHFLVLAEELRFYREGMQNRQYQASRDGHQGVFTRKGTMRRH